MGQGFCVSFLYLDHCDSEIHPGGYGVDFLRLVFGKLLLRLRIPVGRGAFTPPAASRRSQQAGPAATYYRVESNEPLPRQEWGRDSVLLSYTWDRCKHEIKSGKNGLDFLCLVLENCR